MRAQFGIRLLLAAALIISASARAQQTPAAASTGVARLGEYEATYEAGLKKIQAPLLADYALKLQQLLSASAPADQAAVTAELERVRKIIATNGVVDPRSAASAFTQPEPPPLRFGMKQGGMMARGAPPGAVLMLKPEEARGPAAPGAVITIGRADWTVAHLDAGHYEVTVLCSFPPFSGVATLSATLDGETVGKELNSANASGMPGQFPVLRLGRMKFDHDVSGKDLTLQLTSTDLAGVQVRQVILSRPRPPGK